MKSYHHGDLRAALLETTLALVDEVGVEGLSLREVSRRTGVSHTAAYKHFTDKAALVRALVAEAFEEFRVALCAGRDAGTDPLDALRRIGVAYVVFAFEHRTQFKMMFRPELTGIAKLDDVSPASGAYDVLVDGVAAAFAAGLLQGEPETVVLASWSIVHGLAALIVDGPLGVVSANAAPAIEAMASGVLLVFINGARKRERPPAPTGEREAKPPLRIRARK
jgi:AcrR family transcriptional regulator